MSTPNFTTQKQFPLYVWDLELNRDDIINSLLENDEELTKDDITESMISDEFYFTYDIEAQEIVNSFNTILNNILKADNRQLNFLNVVLKDGYYTGLQMFVEADNGSNYSDNAIDDIVFYDNLENYDNSDIRYYFDMCKSKFKRALKSEINYINKKLMPKLALYFGFEEYYCMGIFSNGEAIYRKVEKKNNRAKLIQAIKEVA